jgi:hypothetical protein
VSDAMVFATSRCFVIALVQFLHFWMRHACAVYTVYSSDANVHKMAFDRPPFMPSWLFKAMVLVGEGQKNNLRYLRFFLRKKVSNLNGFFFVGVSFSSFSFF